GQRLTRQIERGDLVQRPVGLAAAPRGADVVINECVGHLLPPGSQSQFTNAAPQARSLSPWGCRADESPRGGEGYLVSIGWQRNPSPGLASLAHPLPQGERVFRTPPRAEPWCSQLRIGCGRAARRFPAACAP